MSVMRLAQLTGTGLNPPTMFVNYNNLPSILISRLLLFAIAGAGFVFLVQTISAGYKYLTSLGEPASIQSATKQLIHALAGLLIVISAFFILQIIQVVFGLPGVLI